MVIMTRIRKWDRRLDVHMSTVCANQSQFVGRDGIRDSKNAMVSFGETGESEADAGVAARAFYNDPAGLEEAFALCFLHCFL